MDDAIQSRRTYVRDVPLDLVDYERAITTLDSWRRKGLRKYACFINPHSVQLCQSDPDMMAAMRNSGLVLADGVGMIWAARILGQSDLGRVAGPTFMLRFCQWGIAQGYRHFFYGGQNGVSERLAERLRMMFPGLHVAGTYSPPFRKLNGSERREVVEMINRSNADVLWVGLGAPKQEKWMLHHCGLIDVPIMLGVGAAFDFHSGNVPWAPSLVRRMGLEWAYRLAQNPLRMWRRNLNNVLFLGGVVRQAMRNGNGYVQ